MRLENESQEVDALWTMERTCFYLEKNEELLQGLSRERYVLKGPQLCSQ